ncbi:hypothetical protein ACTZWT_15330 [Rhodopseudomonas sp. NSM]|uniref:hypothetical protein n=1 Tax=Rhodopseudomonas sp. NSM TaxID=3457630 RepID=UPI004036F692
MIAITSNSEAQDYADPVPGVMPFRGMRLDMKIPVLAVALVAAAVIVFAAMNSQRENVASNEATTEAPAIALAPINPVKTLTSSSCASDGCPVACESGETLLSAICVSGSKARFADSLRVEKGALTATCSTKAGSILVYCGRP